MANAKGVTEIEIINDRCKGCNVCVVFCPVDVLVVKNLKVEVKNFDACTGCMMCENLCPDFAIFVHKQEKAKA